MCAHLCEDNEEVVRGHQGHRLQLQPLFIRQAGNPRHISDAPAAFAASFEGFVEALVAVRNEKAVQRERAVDQEASAGL